MTDAANLAAAIAAVHQATALYTAPHVVDELLDAVGWPAGGGRLLDPSAGDGSVLVRALLKLRPAPGDWSAVRRLVGVEFMASAAEQARCRVSDLLVEQGWARADAASAARTMVIEADFLLDGAGLGTFEYIVGNPPYLRFARLPAHFKATYPGVVPKAALADLLHAFLDACARRLALGGVIAMVTADRWLLNDGAAQLRAAIGQTLGIVDLQRLDAGTSFYRPKDRRRGTPPRVHPIRIVLGASGRLLDAAPVSPDGCVPAPAGPVLGDIASIRIAPWLGPHGVFVLPQVEAGWLPAEARVPAVDTDDIGADDVLGVPSRFAIRTDRSPPAEAVQRHLADATQRLSAGGRRTPFWLPPETITLRLDLPSLLVPRIARRVRAIDVPPGVLPINHNLSVVAAGSHSLEEIKAVLLHADTQAWVRSQALRLENGFLSITTKLLRRVPLPTGLLEAST